jgi:flavin reductase (DIM6/NTAB) family NADH-FMN oxidoreductase RutF
VSDGAMFRRAWGSFATGVSLITTLEKDGSTHGMTANGIASVSLEPMLVMVCVGHNANTFPIIEETGRYGINILSESQRDIGEFYASSANQGNEKFESDFTASKTGIPFVNNALASMDCKVVKAHREGDHTIFIGSVEEIQVNEGKPLLFFASKWMTL